MTPQFARLLTARGWHLDSPELAAFLDPRLDHIHSPWLLAGMEAAVTRALAAIHAGEPIRIWGDYDVDGTLATVILRQALATLGADVSYELPERLGDGYGLQLATVERTVADGVRLAITVDNGIRDLAPLALARDRGLDVVVTDHHLPGPELPPAVAIINPHLPACPYPDKRLCGAAIAFKFAQALLERSGKITNNWPPQLKSYLKLVALAAIADSVPLLGENRALTHFGLEGLARPVNPGLQALLALAASPNQPASPPSARDVAFRLAPRLNAAGRTGSAARVVELFFAPADEAAAIAQSLEAANQLRQAECTRIGSELAPQLSTPESRNDSVHVLAAEGWHRGVLGIAASRVLERTGKPVLIATLEPRPDGGLQAHGSGRAPDGIHLLSLLESCSHLFDRFGGHAQAVGFSLPAARLPDLRAALNSAPLPAAAPIAPNVFDVTLAELTPAFARELESLEPFGADNPEPLFRVRAVRLATVQVLKDIHLKLTLEHGTARATALFWRFAERGAAVPSPGALLDLTFRFRTSRHPKFGERQELIVEQLTVTIAAVAASQAAEGVCAP